MYLHRYFSVTRSDVLHTLDLHSNKEDSLLCLYLYLLNLNLCEWKRKNSGAGLYLIQPTCIVFNGIGCKNRCSLSFFYTHTSPESVRFDRPKGAVFVLQTETLWNSTHKESDLGKRRGRRGVGGKKREGGREGG